QRHRFRRLWRIRQSVGKLLTVLRLAKGVFTFEGGMDYILWKIERHSGVRATATPWPRRHPLLASPLLAWRLYRTGAFRGGRKAPTAQPTATRAGCSRRPMS